MMKNLVVTLATVLLSASLGAAEKREFSLDVPAGDLVRLELQAKVGEVRLLASETDKITVRVTLEPGKDGWFGRSGQFEERLAAAKLVHDTGAGALRVSLDYDRSRLSDDDLNEKWEIRVPERLSVRSLLNVGAMEVRGIGGGLEAEVNVGQLEIDVPRGSVDARVNVGEVSIRNATSSPGRFDLDVNIGEANLRIDGREAGELSGWIGKSVTHSAGGNDDVRARANVGEIKVTIR